MNPFTLAALIGGGTSLIGNLFGSQQQPEQINPYTADFMRQLQDYISSTQAQTAADRTQARQSQAKAGAVGEQIGQTAKEISELQGPDPNAFFNQFMQNIPGYREIAEQTAAEAGRVAGRDVQQQADIASQRAGQNAARAIPGGSGFSGAQAQAVGQATADPLANALAQLSSMSAQNYTNTFNQLAGQGQGLAFQGQQAGFENALNALMGGLQGQSQQANILGNIASQNVNMAGQSSSQLQNLLSMFAQNAGPTYSQPSYTNPIGDAINSIATNAMLAANIFGGQGG